MTKQYFECHITLQVSQHNEAEERQSIKYCVEANGWTYSQIDGDPILGPGTKAYSTKHFNIKQDILSVLDQLQIEAERLRVSGLTVIRIKVEQILFDERY